MKKSSVGSLVVIIGLLILSVLTLTAIYATTPETSVVLLDENFSGLDESRWKQEIAECTEDGILCQNNSENGFTADGILRLQPSLASPELRIKREDLSKCYFCPDGFLFSAGLETKSLFHASSGLVEVRAKFLQGNRLRFWVGIVSNDSQSEGFNNSTETAEAAATANNFAQLEIVIGSAFNRTILKSAVTDEDFHTYEIKWNPDRITLLIDHKKVDEKAFEQNHQARNSSNATASITQPFSLSIGVNFGEKPSENWDTHQENKTSIEIRNQFKHYSEGDTILEVDYIRLFRIERRSWGFI